MKRISVVVFAALIFGGCGTGGVFSSSEATSAGVTDGATGVSAAGSYSVTFPKAVRTETVTEDTFYVAGAPAASASITKSAFNAAICAITNRIAGSVSCSSAYECSYTTTSSLQGNTQYALCLTNGIVYADGTTYVGSTDIFTTGPTVNSISPADGATGISTGTTIEVLFSSAVQESTVTASSFGVSSGGAAVAGSIALNSDRTIAVFTPTSGLQSVTAYTVTLTASILDDAGSTLLPYTSSFTTGETPDTVPPMFSGITSASSDSTSVVTLTWSAAYDDTSLASKIIYYIYASTASGGEDYTSPSYTTSAGTVSYQVTGLAQFTTYYFVARARDEAGNVDDNTIEESAVTLTTNLPAQLSQGSTRNHQCTTSEGGNLYCWGTNSSGQVGDGTTAAKYEPTLIGADWSSVSAGGAHTCGTRTNGTLYCWGSNGSGRLGDGTITQRKSPTQEVSAATDWSSVATGESHTCGTRTNGTIYCWGWNLSGQLGNGSSDMDAHSTPILVLGGYTDWSSASAGASHTCGTRTNGTIYCWGSNSSGQLGDGTTTQRTSPTLVAGGYTDWSSVSTGYSHTCGTRTNGTLYCWGANSSGQLGDGTMVTKYEPTHIGSDTNWSSVAAGYAHTCGTKANGTPYCWGINSSGQLGDGTGIIRYEPTRIGSDLGW